MTIQLSLRERIEQRKKEMQDRKSGIFLKWVSDGDAYLVRIILPFEGYKRLVVNKTNNTSKIKKHFRAFALGGINFDTGQALMTPQPNYTIDDIRKLRIENAKIFTAPESMETGILDHVAKKHSILLVIRKGVQGSTSTRYDVFSETRISEDELSVLAPKLTKQDIAKLDNEVNYEEIISEVELEALTNARSTATGSDVNEGQ